MAHRHPADWGSGDWHRLTVNVPFHWGSLDFCLSSLFVCVCVGKSPFAVLLRTAVSLMLLLLLFLSSYLLFSSYFLPVLACLSPSRPSCLRLSPMSLFLFLAPFLSSWAFSHLSTWLILYWSVYILACVGMQFVPVYVIISCMSQDHRLVHSTCHGPISVNTYESGQWVNDFQWHAREFPFASLSSSGQLVAVI